MTHTRSQEKWPTKRARLFETASSGNEDASGKIAKGCLLKLWNKENGIKK